MSCFPLCGNSSWTLFLWICTVVANKWNMVSYGVGVLHSWHFQSSVLHGHRGLDWLFWVFLLVGRHRKTPGWNVFVLLGQMLLSLELIISFWFPFVFYWVVILLRLKLSFHSFPIQLRPTFSVAGTLKKYFCRRLCLLRTFKRTSIYGLL